MTPRSRSLSIPRRGSAGERHHHHLDFSTLASSFRHGSPLAHEILDRDIDECSTDDDDEHAAAEDAEDNDIEAESEAPMLYRQPAGIATGFRRGSLLPEVVDEHVLNERERKKSRREELSLLRDNHIIPPKHAPEKEPSLLTRVYKNLFSTKVRVPPGDEENGVLQAPTETAPLLAGGSATTPGERDMHQLNEQWDAAVAEGKIHTTWQREAKTIAVYSRSMIITCMLQYSINVASIFAVGHIGNVELGAVSLATMTANITCYAPFQGLATSLDTLCAQAYGSGHRHLVGLQVQRMVFFLFTLMVPVAVLWIFADDILVKLIPDARSAELAGLYLKINIAGLPGFIALEGGKRFVQAQGIFHATTYVLFIVAPLNILLNWLFVWHFGWGFVGAPIAVVITQNLIPVLLVLYVVFVNGSECWGGFSKRAFTNWGPMVMLALPGMLMVEAEWLAFEILTLVSSQFGTQYLAAQSILLTLNSIAFQIPFPLSVAASTRVANLIGAKLVDAAKTSAKVAFWASLLVGVFNATILSSLRYQLPKLFTDDEEVSQMVGDIMFLPALMQIVDCLACMSHGLLRGIGKQHFGGYVNLAVYYAVALPISFGTGLGLGWKLYGLWFGVTVGLFFVAVLEYWYIGVSDWEQSAHEAEHRNQTG